MNFLSLKFFACFFFLVSSMLCSCLTPRKIDKWTTAHYGTTINARMKSNDYITIKTPNTSNDIVAKTEKRKMKLVPALFYWQWEYGTITTLNQLVPANYFSSTIVPYANTKKLKDKLNGQKLELTISKMPAVFSVVDKGGLVFLVLYYIDWDRIFMDPQKQDMVINYRLLKDNVETKTGIITVADCNKPLNVKVFHSVKKTFWSYLDQYNANIQAMSKEAVDKLIAEL